MILFPPILNSFYLSFINIHFIYSLKFFSDELKLPVLITTQNY